MEQLQFGGMPQAAPTLRRLRETPVTRVMQSGAKNVSLLELVGTVVGDADVALRLLTQFPTIDDLTRTPAFEIVSVKGMGQARTAALKAAIELGRRAQLGADVDRKQIRSPADAASLMLGEMSVLDQEEMRVMLLDTRNRVLSVGTIYRGNVNSAILRTGEVFREAVRRNAPAVIVFHNHPSGDPEPSPEDISVTRTIVQAGNLLDIETLDHVVIGHSGRYVSLKDRGLGF